MYDTSDHPNSSRQEWSERIGGTEGGNKKKARREREKTNQAVSLVPVVDREEEREDTRLRVFALLTRWWWSSSGYIECSLTEDIHRSDRNQTRTNSQSIRYLLGIGTISSDGNLRLLDGLTTLTTFTEKQDDQTYLTENFSVQSSHWLIDRLLSTNTRSFAQSTNWFIRLSDSKWIVFGVFSVHKGHSLHEIFFI